MANGHNEWLKLTVAFTDADIQHFICRVESFDDLIEGEQEKFIALKNVCWTEEVRVPKGSGYEVQMRLKRAEDSTDDFYGDTLWVRRKHIRNVWNVKDACTIADEWSEDEIQPPVR